MSSRRLGQPISGGRMNPTCISPIEDHGLIGNMQHGGIGGPQRGRINWLCLPHFDSPSVLFAAILTNTRVGISRSADRQRRYLQTTLLARNNILINRFLLNDGSARGG